MRNRRIVLSMAVVALAAPAAAQSSGADMRSQAQTLRSACMADYQRLCSDVSPGGGRILACLRNHAADLSSDCAKALPAARQPKSDAEQSGRLPK